jgi:3'-phosphoadenosine 5'-phosphosulfate sulfotransferase (PAPS reductase)/FAD synthetase
MMDDMKGFLLYSRLSNFKRKVAQAQEIITSFLGRVNAPYVAWSTGKDSTCVLHMCRAVRPSIRAIHFDLGVELPGTDEYKAGFEDIATWKSSRTVLEVIAENGFGSKKAKKRHLLKEFEQEAKEYDGYLTGMRYDESRERNYLRKYGPVYRKQNGLIVCNPIHNWTYQDSFAYLVAHGIPVHPHYLIKSPQPLSRRRVGGYIAGQNRGDSLGRFFWFQQQYPEKFHELAENVPEIRQYV